MRVLSLFVVFVVMLGPSTSMTTERPGIFLETPMFEAAVAARQKAFAGRTFSLKNGSAGLSTWQTWRKLKIIDGSKERHQTVGCLWICQVSGL